VGGVDYATTRNICTSVKYKGLAKQKPKTLPLGTYETGSLHNTASYGGSLLCVLEFIVLLFLDVQDNDEFTISLVMLARAKRITHRVLVELINTQVPPVKMFTP
jgi:hypothetical protein